MPNEIPNNIIIEIIRCFLCSSYLNKYLPISVFIGIDSYINKSIIGAGIKFAGQNKQKAYTMSSDPTKKTAQHGAYSIYSRANKSCITFYALCPLYTLPININKVFIKSTNINRQ